MVFVVIILLLVCIGIPLAYAFRVWRSDEASRSEWLVVTLEAMVLVALVFLIGRWDIAGYYMRPVLAILFIGALFWSYRKHASRPWRPYAHRPFWRHSWYRLTSLAVFSSALIFVLTGLRADIEPQPMAFPLQHERAFVGQGGGIALLNHHANHTEQSFAIDLTAINAAGFRATGLLPKRLDQYEVWDATVTSPCNGVVVGKESGLPDLIPPAMDTRNASGNHVVLDCGDVRVEMAHFRQGTVMLAIGQPVATGELLGRVGNSGNTTEPHLHVHAYDEDSGRGRPISFGGSTPIRNTIYENAPSLQ